MGITYYIANIKDTNSKNEFLTVNKKNKDISVIEDNFLLYRAVAHKQLLIDDIDYAYSAISLTDLIFGYCCVFDMEDIDFNDDNEDDDDDDDDDGEDEVSDDIFIRALVSERLKTVVDMIVIKRINNKYSIVPTDLILKNSSLFIAICNSTFSSSASILIAFIYPVGNLKEIV